MKRRFVVIALLLLLAAGAVIVYLSRPSADLRTGSVVVDGASVAITDEAPRAYRIVYRSETTGADDVTYATEELVVRRPFEARMEARSGRPPGVRNVGISVNAFTRLRTGEGVFAVGPAPAALDVRVAPSLRDAIRAGLAQAREVRRVAGRLCRIYRTIGPPSGPLERVSDDPDGYLERCFDADGLVLEELVVADGELSRRRVAVGVSLGPRIADDAFEVGDPGASVDRGGGSVQRLRVGSKPPGDFFEADRSPDGFDYEGRYTVIPPQAGFDDPLQRGRIVAFTSDVWTGGIDAIVVEQGAALAGPAPFERARDGIDVRLGDLGRGQIVYTPLSAEVRVLLDSGGFVRILGTVPPDELVDFARRLERVEGGTIVVES